MKKKTFVIVSGIITALTTATETIIPLFELTKESAILGAVAAVGTAAISILGCFVTTTEPEKIEA